MKKNSQLLLLLFVISSVFSDANAQHFQRTLGGISDEAPYRMINAIDGGYIIAGYTMSYGNSPGSSVDGYVIKTDNDGHILWSKTYGTVDADQIYWIEPTLDSSYLFCGQTVDQITGNSLLNVARISLTGDLIWQKNYKVGNYESGSTILMLSDGGFILGGQCDISSDEQLLMMRCDSTGNVLWKKYFGGPDIENAEEIIATSDGGYLVVGTSRYGFYSTTLFLVKTDSLGNSLWSKTYNTSAALRKVNPAKVYQLNSGGYIISGTTTALGLPLSDILMMRLDDTGNIIWQKLYVTSENDRADDMLIDENGNYIVCGATAILSTGGFYDALIMKIDSSGNYLNSFVIGIPDEDETALNMIWNAQQQLMVSGFVYGRGIGETDIFLFSAEKEFDTLVCNSSTVQFTTDTSSLVATPYNGTWVPVVFESNGVLNQSTGGLETELCNLNSVEDDFSVHLLMSPNPVSNVMKIMSENKFSGSLKVLIYDIAGRLVQSKIINHFSGENEVDVSTLNTGAYVVVISDNNHSARLKFIKN